MTKYFKIDLAVLAAAVAADILAYPYLPDRLASHWDLNGQVNGYMPKTGSLIFMPALILLMLAIRALILKFDPLAANIKKFNAAYEQTWLVIIGFLFYIQLLTLGWNLGYRFNLSAAIVPAFAALFWFLGSVLENSKRNWSVGIRTPWTLSSDVVWDRTHRLGAKLFRASALLALGSLLFPAAAAYLMVVPILAASLILVVYSYVEYAKEKRTPTPPENR
ncbi:MAG: SdpI family protein [Patescibacteria group bacterium]|jgi:uncharacterized membrane protein